MPMKKRKLFKATKTYPTATPLGTREAPGLVTVSLSRIHRRSAVSAHEVIGQNGYFVNFIVPKAYAPVKVTVTKNIMIVVPIR